MQEAFGEVWEARLFLPMDLDEETYKPGAPDGFPTATEITSHRMKSILDCRVERENPLS